MTINIEAIYAKWNGREMTTPGGCRIHVVPEAGDKVLALGRAPTPDEIKQQGLPSADLDAAMTGLFGDDWRSQNTVVARSSEERPKLQTGKPVLDDAFAASVYARWNNRQSGGAQRTNNRASDRGMTIMTDWYFYRHTPYGFGYERMETIEEAFADIVAADAEADNLATPDDITTALRLRLERATAFLDELARVRETARSANVAPRSPVRVFWARGQYAFAWKLDHRTTVIATRGPFYDEREIGSLAGITRMCATTAL